MVPVRFPVFASAISVTPDVPFMQTSAPSALSVSVHGPECSVALKVCRWMEEKHSVVHGFFVDHTYSMKTASMTVPQQTISTFVEAQVPWALSAKIGCQGHRGKRNMTQAFQYLLPITRDKSDHTSLRSGEICFVEVFDCHGSVWSGSHIPNTRCPVPQKSLDG